MVFLAPPIPSCGGFLQLFVQVIMVAEPASSVPLRCLVGTWNVGNAAPSPDLKSWLDNKARHARARVTSVKTSLDEAFLGLAETVSSAL